MAGKSKNPSGKKKATAKTIAKRRSRTTSSNSASDSSLGPLTLDQAKAQVKNAGSAPRVARRGTRRGNAAKSVAPQVATTTIVGQAKLELAKQQDATINARLREYESTMSLLKQRGVKGLQAAATKPSRRRGPTATAASALPLQIFAEGDSWFDYPAHPIGGGLVPRLERRLGVPILNLAKAGDEVRFMLGVKSRQTIKEQFTNGCPAGGPWDVMLFSGGGNDIVGDPMALWIKNYRTTATPNQLIDQTRFGAALQIVKAGYEDLIQLRDSLSPSTLLVFHGYDYAIPDGRGVCLLGPWLKPTFDLRGFPTVASAFPVVKEMLRQFAAMLIALESSNRQVKFINGQGTLNPVAASWHNELHPSRAGFDQFAELFHQEIKARFPTRVI